MWLFKLFRWPNLLIIALTHYLLRHAVLLPTLHEASISSSLSEWNFTVLVLAMVLAAASGYLINDLYDFEIDQINKPDRVIVGRKLTIPSAWSLYVGLLVVSATLVGYLVGQTGQYYLLAFFPLLWYSLWLYSKRLKAMPFWGNFTVALVCASVVALVWKAERPSLLRLHDELAFEAQAILLFYGFFAFFSTMYRELVKDMEDLEGDQAHGCRTLPIVWGEQYAKVLGMVWGASLGVGSIAWLYWAADALAPSAVAGMLLLLLLNGYSLYQFAISKDTNTLGKVSQQIKLLMLLGLIYLLIA